eukprot:m.30891 g.30891  ORF g.30891 m.30891 type:complete len:132 (+) comp9672_c0_seq2:85-480(+)
MCKFVKSKEQNELEKELIAATREGDVENVTWLLANGANVNCWDQSILGYNRTPMHWSAIKGHLGVMKVLVAHGADTGCRDKWNRSPLHKAAINGHINIVQFLVVENNAEVNCKDEVRPQCTLRHCSVTSIL